MTTTEVEYPLQANGARTSDWIGQIEDGVLYAYDLDMQETVDNGTTILTKEDFENDLRKVSRKI